ncbi:MAG TPA: FecR family protein [Pseudolabrys sp.]|nr:FecR family protein [Pseudolabrys sp.]
MRALENAVLATAAILFAGMFLLAPVTTQSALAQDASIKPIGKVVTATGAVTIEHVSAVVVQAALGNQPINAKTGDPIYLGDVVATGSDGRVGITFLDGTAFDLSSNARMVMNEYVYDPNSQSNSTLLSLTKGTFTFVAGKIAKSGDMKVNTPVATMGIRGTTPRVEISDDGSVKFSTLIEDGKDRILRGGGSGNAPPIIEERNKPNLNICRGC